MTNLISVRGILLSILLQVFAAPFAMSAQVPDAPWWATDGGMPLPAPLFPTVEGACGYVALWLSEHNQRYVYKYDHMSIELTGPGGNDAPLTHCILTIADAATGEVVNNNYWAILSEACNVIGAHWNSGRLGCTCGPSQTYYPVSEPTDPNHPWADWACFPYVENDQTGRPPSCKANPGYGNPIFPLTGVKREYVNISRFAGWKPIVLTYDSTRQAPGQSSSDAVPKEQMPFGKLWQSSLHKRIAFGSTKRDARIENGDGSAKIFLGSGDGNYAPAAGISDDLVYMKNTGGGYRHYDWQNRALEIYDSTGRLTDVFSEAGQVLSFFYSSAASAAAPASGYLIQVQDRFGRGFSFQYELPAGGDPATDARVSRITAPGGLATTLSYDAYGNLSRIRWPDDSIRQFVYERIDLPWALTGVLDENNARAHTFGWDGEGRAISTEMASGVNRFSATYAQPPRVLVDETLDAANKIVMRTRRWQSPVAPAVRLPNGAVSTLGSSTILGMPAFSGGTQPAGSGWSLVVLCGI